MKVVTEIYNQLHDLGTTNNLGDTHGILETHKGINTPDSPILIVGRETRGMGTSINNTKLPIENFPEGDLFWLDKKDGYYYGKSPFWRVVGKSISQIDNMPYNYDVYETIFWANLYKIAPTSKSPNLKKTQNIQRELCADLLVKEIEVINPRLVIFITGEWIHSFKQKWQNNGLITDYKSVETEFFNTQFNFKIKDSKVPATVVPHPQGKKEQPIINNIVNFAKNLK